MRSWVLLCGLLAACGGGDQQCAADQASCGGTCVDTLTAHDNCGTCGHACAASEVCGNGTCGASCPGNQSDCSGTCSDPTTDAMNCGGCGMACTGGDVCVDSQCQIPCDAAMLMSPITDPWGVAWDGLERTTQALDAAKVTCATFGARLPTPSEIYRVSATQSGAVGQSFNTNYLWSLAPNDKLNQATVRLSDGVASTAAAATPTTFRCVCPASLPKTFTGGHCNGAPGAACFALGNYNIDTKDRPALRRSAAVWECLNEHAHLATSSLLVEGIRAGLPASNASGIATADEAEYQSSVTLKWTTTAFAQADVGGAVTTTAAAFRCAAPNVAQTPNPTAIPNKFTAAATPYTGETVDTATATFAPAHDACFIRGGHLPRTAEYAELIMAGLPGGSDVNLWTSDEDGYHSTGLQFLVETVNWTALEQRFSYVYTNSLVTGTIDWDYKTTTHPFRCIYYPIDPNYVAPTTCTGGCSMVAGGSTTMWFDTTDRAAKTFSDAVADCATSGGHLPSERDMTEAIRSGLPNGSAAYLLTADFGFGDTAGHNTMVVKWTGTQTGYTDQYNAVAASSFMTWANPDTARVYRCMWTNELR